ATIDPNGKCTNGIDRIYTHRTNAADDNSKLNPWPNDKYLNVWVAKTLALGGGVLAYATFPSSNFYGYPSQGVLMKSNVVGSIGTSNLQYSITLTHEIGHYLNLSHCWGNSAVATACGDDGVLDTPETKGHQNACSTADLFTPICTVNGTSNPYNFSKVTLTSGVTDTTAAPVSASAGAVFGRFSAVGVAANSSDVSSFAFANWTTGGILANSDTTFALLTGSLNTSQYYEVTVTPNARNSATLNNISFTFQRSGTGVRSFAVRSSVDGYTNNLPASAGSSSFLSVRSGNQFFSVYDTTSTIFGSLISLGGASYTNFMSPITFRFYGWNAEDASGTFSIDDVSLMGTVGPLENIQNYMDYTWCLPTQTMFTYGQKDRMRAALRNVVGQRDNLSINSNLLATGTDAGTHAICAPYPDFFANRNNICTGGTVTFTKNILNGAATGTATWSFPGGTPSSSTLASPTVKYNTPGVYDVKLVAGNSTGTDSVIKTYYIKVNGGATSIGPSVEPFEDLTRFWSWQVYNFDENPHTWGLTKTGYNSSQSVIMEAYGNYKNDVDELISPSFDLSMLTNASLTFRCAAGSIAQVALDLNDALNIYSSNDCGQTWALRTTLQGPTFINDGFHSEYFVPTSASQWKLQTVAIPNSLATSDIRFKFEYVTGSKSNNIYIDDINLDGTVGMDENNLEANKISIYPNPATQTSKISYHLIKKSEIKIALVDVLGKKIMETTNTQTEGDYSFLVSKQDLNLKNGIYFVKFSIDNNTITKKLIISE
ncbi:MAG: T9SS type A sorting domain-containing protein, partial [Bacteroidetes bacterium]|nr:T9SS type A sorting domain-containing protein [Bacteroidota bacterium]